MNEVPWAVSLIVSFLPLVMVVGGVVWHGRQLRKCMTAADGRSLADVFAELAREKKRENDLREAGTR